MDVMTWSVINKTGIGYVLLPESDNEKLLHSPRFAAQVDDGTYLIVDELGGERQVPFSFVWRTIRVEAGGSILYDSLDDSFDDGYGCLLWMLIPW